MGYILYYQPITLGDNIKHPTLIVYKMSKRDAMVIPKYIKKHIPRALREQVWIKYANNQFEMKCPITWCENKINAFNFQVGHNIPESKGGKTEIENLRPICSRCNLSMGNRYSIDEWTQLSASTTVPVVPIQRGFFTWCC